MKMHEQFTIRQEDGLNVYRRDPIDVVNHTPSIETADISLGDSQQWLNQIHAEHLAQPNAIHARDIDYERKVWGYYFGALEHHAPEYMKTIKCISDSLPPMNSDCRLAVTIPARREAETIFASLRHMLVRKFSDTVTYAQQDAQGNILDPSNYEVTLVVNKRDGEADDATRAEAERLIDEHDFLSSAVHLVDVSLPDNLANIGMAKRLAQDVTMLRASQRQRQSGSLYIATEDADATGYDCQLFHRYISYLDNNVERSAVRSRVERDPGVLREVPYAFLHYRFTTQIVTILHSEAFQPDRNSNYDFRVNRDVPEGLGTAFVAADLALCGGFPIVERAENLLVGEQLAALFATSTESHPSYITVGRLPNIVLSSPRRTLAGYIMGVNPYAGSNFNTGPTAHLVNEPLQELVAQAKSKSNINAREWLQQNMQRGLDKLYLTAPDTETARTSMNLVLLALGFESDDYTLDVRGDGMRISVHEWGNVEYCADQYRLPVRMQRCAYTE